MLSAYQSQQRFIRLSLCKNDFIEIDFFGFHNESYFLFLRQRYDCSVKLNNYLRKPDL